MNSTAEEAKMILKQFLDAYNRHTNVSGPPPPVFDLQAKFPVGSFVIDDRGNVGLVTDHTFINPPPKGGPLRYGSIMFIGRNGRMWSSDFLQMRDDNLRAISRLEMMARAAERDTTELESFQSGKREGAR